MKPKGGVSMKNCNFICSGKYDSEICPVFLCEFAISKPLTSAQLFITAKGVYEAVLNGERVGEFVMAPGWTSYENRLQIQKYDITNMLDSKNRLEVILSNGWFAGLKSRPLNKERVSFIAKIIIINTVTAINLSNIINYLFKKFIRMSIVLFLIGIIEIIISKNIYIKKNI